MIFYYLEPNPTRRVAYRLPFAYLLNTLLKHSIKARDPSNAILHYFVQSIKVISTHVDPCYSPNLVRYG